MQENWYDWAVRTKDYLHNATLSQHYRDGNTSCRYYIDSVNSKAD